MRLHQQQRLARANGAQWLVPGLSRQCTVRCSANAVSSWSSERVKHVVDSQQFDKLAMEEVFAEALKMEKVKPGTPEARMLDGFVMSTLFYEPSTRTRLSFESAMSRLGGVVLSTESAGEYSSAAKGETLEGELPRASLATANCSQQQLVRCPAGDLGGNWAKL